MKNFFCFPFFKLIDCGIDLEAKDLSEGILREFLVTDLKNTYLLIRNCGAVIRINVGLKMSLEVLNIILGNVIGIGINLCNDGVIRNASLGMALVNYYIKNAGSGNKLVFDLLGINVLSVRENDKVLDSTGDVYFTVRTEFTNISRMEEAVGIDCGSG